MYLSTFFSVAFSLLILLVFWPSINLNFFAFSFHHLYPYHLLSHFPHLTEYKRKWQYYFIYWFYTIMMCSPYLHFFNSEVISYWVIFRFLTAALSLQRTFYFSPSTLYPNHIWIFSILQIHFQTFTHAGPHYTGCSQPGVIKVLWRLGCRYLLFHPLSPAFSTMHRKNKKCLVLKKKTNKNKLLVPWYSMFSFGRWVTIETNSSAYIDWPTQKKRR